jgi:spore germination protein KB
MNKEYITSRQASSILIMFIFGSTLLFGVGADAGRDVWMSMIITLAMTVPFIFLYSRIMSLFPEKNIFEIIEDLFGKVFGKILMVLFIWYALHLAASVLRNFTDFLQVTSLIETPQIAIAIIMFIAIVYLARSGIETFGRWSVVTVFIICAIVIMTVLLSISSMKFSHFLPVLDTEWSAIISSALRQSALPFGEIVLFLGIADSLKKSESPYKAYLFGILYAGVISMLIVLRNVAVLGPAMLQSVYFPSFVAAKIINPSEFFARVESLIAMNYLFAGVTKISLCIFVAAKGISCLINASPNKGSYKNFIVPISLLCILFSMTFYDSLTYLFDFVKNYYAIYLIPFQIILPLLIWITAEIRRIHRKKAHSLTG